MNLSSNSIRELREMQGLSQEGFAKVIGVSVRTVARWESGASKPSSLAVGKLEQTKTTQSERP